MQIWQIANSHSKNRKISLDQIDEESNPSFISNMSPRKENSYNKRPESLTDSKEKVKNIKNLQKFHSDVYEEIKFDIDGIDEGRMTLDKKDQTRLDGKSRSVSYL